MHLNYTSQTGYSEFCDLQLVTKWNNRQSNPTTDIICVVCRGHNKTTYLNICTILNKVEKLRMDITKSLLKIGRAYLSKYVNIILGSTINYTIGWPYNMINSWNKRIFTSTSYNFCIWTLILKLERTISVIFSLLPTWGDSKNDSMAINVYGVGSVHNGAT